MDGVGLPARFLGADEHEVMHMRTHAKALFWPAVGLVLSGGVVGAGAALVPGDLRPGGQLAVVVVGVALAVWWAVIPCLRWLTTTYTLTTRRLIVRSGLLTKTGRDLPLMRVNDVAFSRSLTDRLLGCGTLRIKTAADAAVIELPDVPDVDRVHVMMSDLLFGSGEPDR